MTFLCVDSMKGFDQPALPASLPMGSVEAFRSWIVTNQVIHYNNAIYFTNTSGELEGYGNFGAKNFNSYTTYLQFTGSNSFNLFNSRRSAMDPDKMLQFFVTIDYYIPEIAQVGWAGWVRALYLEANVGLVSSITSNSFVTVNPKYEFVYMNVPGLEQFKVEVKGVYSNSWPAQIAGPGTQSDSPTQFPPEFTTNNYVVLNSWYSMGDTNETRISIKVGGKTRRYTQFGQPLDKNPTVTIKPESLFASFARGAQVTIESSTNMINWTSVTNFSDTKGTGFISLPYTKNQPREFFRVGIR